MPLLALAFLDELWSGVPVVQAPAIEHEHGLSHGPTALVLLTVVHVFMVMTVDPYSLRSMITGNYNEARSPEARNARPFLWRRARPAQQSETSADATIAEGTHD